MIARASSPRSAAPTDASCPRCGYPLPGLKGLTCPECGQRLTDFALRHGVDLGLRAPLRLGLAGSIACAAFSALFLGTLLTRALSPAMRAASRFQDYMLIALAAGVFLALATAIALAVGAPIRWWAIHRFEFVRRPPERQWRRAMFAGLSALPPMVICALVLL